MSFARKKKAAVGICYFLRQGTVRRTYKMSASETPSYSSSRIQRAYRINKLEQSRLSGTLHLLEKQKVHQMRLTNKDIRMISVSLDYIQSSSGKSPEGAPPMSTKSDTDEESSSEEKDIGPYFMYGERIVSRRTRRFRSHSAVTRGRNSRGSVSSVVSESVTSLCNRPHSSPARRPPKVVWQISSGEDSDRCSDSESERTDVTSISVRRSNVKCDWEHDVSEVTKKILKAQAEKRKDPRRALPTSIRRHGAFDDMPSSPVSPLSLQSRSTSPNLYPPRRASITGAPGRNAQLSEILNQRRPTMSASQWRNHLSQTHTAPMPMAVARQQVQHHRLRVNDNARDRIQARVREFIETTVPV